MCNYRNCYLDESLLGKENSWEYYFEQPYEYSIKQAYQGRNIIMSSMDHTVLSCPTSDIGFLNNEHGALDIWREIAKKYMRVKRDIIIESEKQYELLMQGRRCLGVSTRGTDYTALRPSHHPIMPEVETVINDAELMLQTCNCECLYLNTEDKDIINSIKGHFQDKCILYKRKLVNYTGGYIIDNLLLEEYNERKLSGREYLISVLLLVQTNALLAGRPSSVVGAEMMSSGWEYQKIYDLGYYE
jgi:hypothetical protein